MTVDTRAAQASLRQLSERGARAAQSRALNKSAVSVRVEAARAIRQEIMLKVGDVNKAVKIIKATRNKLEAFITASGNRIGVIKFGARQTRKGVTYRVDPKKPRQRLAHAFIAKGRGGGLQVFQRKPGSKRLPIWKRDVPGIAENFVKLTVLHAQQRKFREVWPKYLEHEMQYEINKAGLRAGAGGHRAAA